ncbi:hypothetical protein [Evansella cellulosilytica]|uniref:Uncharacterized protein n=1 Tax=Evansella cellulosilytica (strain ATCC 21833 / DSM 2522 / FERM P-1141 / JCM 9156 / N-4) TaxID=649639 RepID=E6TWC0_EVAC2|nr:hypothetical protein [Evansella cellulosilytica]ADU31076.1 hypothetical protein Bcell_2823 [Evansella cellulosilytica DSM 2522]
MSKFERMCIKVPKVYDWITHQAEKQFQFDQDDLDFFTVEDPALQTTDTLVDDVCAYFLPETVKVDAQLLIPEPKKWMKHDGDDICQEVGEREDFFYDELDANLQIVKLQKQGEFQIILSADKLPPLYSEPIPFFKLEKVVLCAPEGTDVVCDVYDIVADGSFVCNGDGTEWTIDLSLLICQSIQAEAIVKVEVEGKHCKPREEIPLPIVTKECPDFEFPPQCPTVFPRPHKK